jgi:hypothetical protein
MKILIRLTLLSFVIATGVAMASAEKPGQHPTYIHGISDLQDARAHIDYHGANEKRDVEEEHAIRELNAAIYAATHAAIKDDKAINNHPPADVNLARTDRYNQVRQLLDSARRDVSGKEDNPEARALQSEAISHINAASQILEDLQRKYR